MATLPKLLFYGDCSSFGFTAPNVMMKQRGKGYQGIRATEAFEHKNTRSSNVVITKKNEKTFQTIPDTQETLSDKDAQDIEEFTDEPEFQCDAEVVKNTFQMIPNK